MELHKLLSCQTHQPQYKSHPQGQVVFWLQAHPWCHQRQVLWDHHQHQRLPRWKAQHRPNQEKLALWQFFSERYMYSCCPLPFKFNGCKFHCIQVMKKGYGVQKVMEWKWQWCFHSSAVLCVSLRWYMVKTCMVRLRVIKSPNAHEQIAFCAFY